MSRARAEWKDAIPGDVAVLAPHERLESVNTDKDFSIGDTMLYSLCIARVESKTTSGLVLLKVYLLTPNGVGYKRLNVEGDDRRPWSQVTRKWT